MSHVESNLALVDLGDGISGTLTCKQISATNVKKGGVPQVLAVGEKLKV